MKKTQRPHIICHMVSSVDGRIQPHHWPMATAHKLYEKCHNTFQADAWIIGRTSMEGFSSRKIKRLPKAPASLKKDDYIAATALKKYAVVIDSKGKCRWDSNEITGDHVVEVLTTQVSRDYLAHLRQKEVSYIFAGTKSVDLEVAVRKLRSLFGIRTLLLEGGGIINGSFLKAGLIDELSQLVIPLADGSIGTPSVFDAEVGHTKRKPTQLKLKQVKKFAGDVLWLRYSMT